jgi:transposase
MRKNSSSSNKQEAAACGIDLGSRHSEISILDAEGELIERQRIPTTQQALERAFAQRRPLLIAIETGGQTNWVRRQLAAYGHEVVVADAKRVKLITDTHSKDDRRDARWLAEILLRWPELLKGVQPRSIESERHRALLKARECLVEARVKLILSVRGILNSFGRRLPAITSEAFARKAAAHVPESLQAALQPTLDAVQALSLEIRIYDRQIEQLCRTRYRAAAERLRSIPGVGAQTALAFTLELDDDPSRLRCSRAAGAWVGLRPNAASRGCGNRSCRSPKSAIACCANCSSSAPTISLAADPTAPCAVGGWRWRRAAEPSAASAAPSSRSPANSPYCCMRCGVKTRTSIRCAVCPPPADLEPASPAKEE